MPKYTNYGEYLESMGLVLKDGASIFCLNPETGSARPGPFCEERRSLVSANSVGALRSIIITGSKQFSSGTMGSILRIAGGEFSTLRAKQMLESGDLKKNDVQGWFDLVKFDFGNWGYGILTTESITDDKIMVKIDECMSCAGMPKLDKAVCYYEGGRITGGLSEVTGELWQFKEVNCWGLGDDFCRFELTKVK
ncbi:MAG: V4R domain protein [Methanobacterium sp. PtaU1.Bin242]|nr:MAG: V4R domain protein [Methanobacterium sp. PtaU1.Bin242]